MYRVETFQIALLAVALLAAARPGAADAAGEDVVSQEIDVQLAEIEVFVTDRQGEPVAGLKRQDFELQLDGQPVELTHFRAIVAGRSLVEVEAASGGAASGQTASEAAGRLNLVIYIDRAYLEPGDLGDVRDALKNFLRQGLGPGDRTMLVVAGHSLELEQAFTTVPELVITKLDAIRERPGGGRLAREYRSILRQLRRTKGEGSEIMARDPNMQASSLLAQAQAYAAEVNGEIRGTTSRLLRLIQSVAGLPGRRAVFYIGGRVPAAYPRRLFDAWEEAYGRNSSHRIPSTPGTGGSAAGGDLDGAAPAQGSTSFDSLIAASSGFMIDAEKMVGEVAASASANGIIFHTLDAAGLRSSTGFAAAGDMALPGRGSAAPIPSIVPGSLSDSLASLRRLATDTGGRSFTGSRDFTSALSKIGSDFRTFYSLGFEPPEAAGVSRIKVTLRRDPGRLKGLDVRHRPLIQLKDRDTLAAERTVSALLLEEMENPLEVEVSIGEPTAAGKEGWRVPVSINVPLARLALVADGRAHTGRLSIFVTSGTLQRMAPVTKAVVPVRIANRDLLTSLGRRVAYQFELIVPSGLGRIAVTVRDDFRPQSSTTVASWGVDSFPDGAAGTPVP